MRGQLFICEQPKKIQSFVARCSQICEMYLTQIGRVVCQFREALA